MDKKLLEFIELMDTHVHNMAKDAGNIYAGIDESSNCSFLEQQGVASLYGNINTEFKEYSTKFNKVRARIVDTKDPDEVTQKLIDICFNLVHDSIASNRTFTTEKDRENAMEWVAYNLKEGGFPTKQVGSSWGILQKEK